MVIANGVRLNEAPAYEVRNATNLPGATLHELYDDAADEKHGWVNEYTRQEAQAQIECLKCTIVANRLRIGAETKGREIFPEAENDTEAVDELLNTLKINGKYRGLCAPIHGVNPNTFNSNSPIRRRIRSFVPKFSTPVPRSRGRGRAKTPQTSGRKRPREVAHIDVVSPAPRARRDLGDALRGGRQIE